MTIEQLPNELIDLILKQHPNIGNKLVSRIFREIDRSTEFQLEFLFWLKNTGWKFRPRFSEIASRDGKVEILDWLVKNRLEVSDRILVEAIENNKLTVLLWAKDQGTKINYGELLKLNSDLFVKEWLINNQPRVWRYCEGSGGVMIDYPSNYDF